MNYYDEIKKEIEDRVDNIERLHDYKTSKMLDYLAFRVLIPSFCSFYKDAIHGNDYFIRGNIELPFFYENLIRFFEDKENKTYPIPSHTFLKALVYIQKKAEEELESDAIDALEWEGYEERKKEKVLKNEGRLEALRQYAKDHYEIIKCVKSYTEENWDRATSGGDKSEKKDKSEREDGGWER